MTRRGVVRRTVYLLTGGAIAIAFLILASSLYAPLQPDSDADLRLFVPLTLGMMVGVGLLPGIREVQVAGAQTLLGAEDVLVPEPMRARHRWRTALWTFLHQVVGFGCGLLVTLAVLGVSALVVLAAGRASLGVPGLSVERPDDLAGWAILVGIVVGIIAVAGTLVVAAGAAATWSAPLLLGASGQDRLLLAEQRLAREREYRRLSRDLHDGVGHSLSAISLQAAAGRRVLGQASPSSPQAERTLESLGTIEELAGRAVAELDHALGVLRRDAQDSVAEARVAEARVAEAELARLDTLVTEHRSWGMDLHPEVTGDLGGLPPVLSRTAYRICAEALANAAKHGGPGAVLLRVSSEPRELVVEVDSPLLDGVTGEGHGRGLTGLRETVGLLGGSLDAGPVDLRWVLRVRLPRGARRG